MARCTVTPTDPQGRLLLRWQIGAGFSVAPAALLALTNGTRGERTAPRASLCYVVAGLSADVGITP